MTARIQIVAILLLVCMLLGGMSGVRPALAQTNRIEQIQIVGAQRIDPETVRSYLLIAPGDVADPVRLDHSLKALYGTGLFADVTIRQENGTLIVNVIENPVINRIAFEGNLRIDDETLEKEIQLRPRLVFTRTRVQQDVQRLITVYRLSGRYASKVEPKVIQLEQNRVDLVFEIDEGPLTSIRSISFIGNRRFSDSDLRDEIETKEYAVWRLLTTNDTYDPDRLSFDRELLRRFYLQHGYADFRVTSAVAELTQDREAFVVTFTLDEGQRYRVGDVGLDVQLRRISEQDLRPLITTVSGDWYDSEEVEASIDNLTDQLGTMGYAFVDIRPRVRQDREKRLVHLIYNISEAPKVFVERIEIVGNVRTLDEVVRREFELIEGDAFNTSKLRRSRRRIRNLGFFAKVEVNNTEGSGPDKTVIQAKVEEKSTGEVSFGAGFSSIDGIIADFGISERNLLGRGQRLRFQFRGSTRSQEFDVGFTEPYFLDRDLSASVSLFQTTRDRQSDSSFDERRTGGDLKFGYELARDLRQSVGYSLKRTEIRDVKDTASRFIKEQEGRNTVSEVTQSITYDKRDNRNNPSEGYFVRMSNDLAGLGGDSRFLRTRLRGGYYIPVRDNWVVSLLGEAGYIFGIGEDVEIAERFFVGGSIFRGFARSGIGPRDSQTDDVLGGNKYYVGTVELSFPIGLPDDLGVKAFIFSDAGSLWGIDDSGPEILDTESIRMSIGTGIAWTTVLGLIRLDFAQAVLKESFDDTEVLRFSFGTRF